MAKIKAPLFSLDASGTLDKTITYRNKPQNKTASKYAKPGSVNPFESSPRQKDQRSIIGLITACWQCKTSLDQLAWNNAAKDARFKGTGYHYFLHMAQSDLTTYLGLVGFWSMNYNIGDKIPDLSGNGNHGTLMPIYPCDCPQPVDSFSNKSGKALFFDTINDYIICNDLPSLRLTTSITLAAFVYLKEFDYGGIIAKGTLATATAASYSICTRPTDINFDSIISDIRYQLIFDSISLHKWYFLTATFDGSKLDIYINGNFNKTQNTIPLGMFKDNTTRPLYIGFRVGYYSTNKIIDNVLIYDRALLPKEIQRLYSLFI